MKDGLIPGTQAQVEFVVTPEMRPIFDDVAVHQVCSTWSLVHFMELAGRKLLLQFLEPHEEGVGSHASCDHLSSVRVGRRVRVVATATSVSERELICDVVAYRMNEAGASDVDRPLARGKTVQKVFPRNVLERILARE